MKRRILITLAVVIPLTIFFAAREMAELRPEQMTANSPQTHQVESFIARQSHSSRWTAMMMEGGKAFLWDKERQKMRANIGAGIPIFSDDEKWFAVVRPLIFDGPVADYPRPFQRGQFDFDCSCGQEHSALEHNQWSPDFQYQSRL